MGNNSFLVVLLVLFYNFAIGQKNSKPIYKLVSESLEIKTENNVPVVYTTEEYIIYYPTYESTQYMNSHTLVLSGSDELIQKEGFVLINKGDKKKKIKLTEFKVSGYDSEGIFVNDNKQITCQFLGLESGAEVHLKFVTATQELHYFNPFYFQRFLEVEKLHYEINIDYPFAIELKEFNFIGYKIKKAKETLKNSIRYSYEYSNANVFEMYSDAPSLAYFVPHVLLILNKKEDNRVLKNFLSSPIDIFKWYVQITENVKEKETQELKNIVSEISKTAKTEDEKIQKTFEWVKRNIRYIAFEAGMGGLVYRPAYSVCKKKYGDCKDMANLITYLLSMQNIQASRILIGTRSIPYTYTEVYSKNADNHMIAGVKRNGKWIYLDATDPNGIYGLPTSHIQGKQALIILDENNFELQIVPVVDQKENVISKKYEIDIQNEDIIVKAKIEAFGLISGSFKNALLYVSEKDKEEFILNYFKPFNTKIEMINFNIPEVQNNFSMVFTASFKLKNAVRNFAGEKYLNLNLEKLFNQEKIDVNKRRAPLELENNRIEKFEVHLTIPKNGKVTNLPENSNFDNEGVNYSSEYKIIKNKVIYKKSFGIQTNNLLITNEKFNTINEVIKLMNSDNSKSISL